MATRKASPGGARPMPKRGRQRIPRPRTWGRAQRVEYEEDGGVPYTVMATEQDEESLGFAPKGFPPDRVFIKQVEHESWAERHGVVKGDELMAVEGKDIRMLSGEEFESILLRRPILLTFRCGPRHLESDGIPTADQLDFRGVLKSTQSGFDNVHDSEAHHMMPFTVVLTKENSRMGWFPSALPPKRVFVDKVEKHSWAKQNGIQKGDELLTVGDKRCAAMTADEFQESIRVRPLALSFQGKGDRRQALEEGEDGNRPQKPLEQVEFSAIAAEVDKRLGFKTRLIVSEVEQGSWADKRGLASGDCIVAINGQLLSTLLEDAEAVKKVLGKRPCLLNFLRSGSAEVANVAVQADQHDQEKREQEEAERAEIQRELDEKRQNFDAFRDDDSSDDGEIMQRRLDHAASAEVASDSEEEFQEFEDDGPPPPLHDEFAGECWDKLGNATITSSSFGPLPITSCTELWLQHLRHGAFTGLQVLNVDCVIKYVGSPIEDLALKVFKGTTPRDPGSFHFVGYIHLMQDAVKNTVKVNAEGRSYYLGLEVVMGLNSKLLSESKAEDALSRHQDLVNDFQKGCELSVDNADFLLYFTSRDASLNNACLAHLTHVGVRMGPWHESPRKVAVCTDLSLGLGRHFGDKVNLHLGNHDFALAPPAETSAEAWFDELAEMSARTQFGILLVNPSTRYLRANGCRTECRLIPGDRQYVYNLREDCIMLLSDLPGKLGQTRSKLLEAATRGHLAQARAILEGDPLSCICDVDEADDTALHVASLKGQRAFLKMLLEAGADPNAQNCWGSTPLHAAIVGGDEVNLVLLLEHNAGIDIQDNQGNTALHLAASRGLEGMVVRLLDMKADAEWQNADGETALDVAALWGHVGIALLLRDAEDVDDIRDAEFLEARRAKEREEAEEEARQARERQRQEYVGARAEIAAAKAEARRTLTF